MFYKKKTYEHKIYENVFDDAPPFSPPPSAVRKHPAQCDPQKVKVDPKKVAC